jgi:hypothetical protein
MDYGCRWKGVPHDLVPVGETSAVKVERCAICNRRFTWHKGFKGRVANAKYLKAHARNFAQKGGATHRLFMKLYEPEKAIIEL